MNAQSIFLLSFGLWCAGWQTSKKSDLPRFRPRHSCSPSRHSHDGVHSRHNWRGGDEIGREGGGEGLEVGKS